MTPEQIKLRDEWIAALRSGKYKQGRHALKNDHGEYCCLGVLCEISGIGKFDVDGYFGLDDGAEHVRSFPPVVVANLVGIGSGGEFNPIEVSYEFPTTPNGDEMVADVMEVDSLPMLNDKAGWTFEQIADFIESNPEGLFV